jgi:hypothetical protein
MTSTLHVVWGAAHLVLVVAGTLPSVELLRWWHWRMRPNCGAILVSLLLLAILYGTDVLLGFGWAVYFHLVVVLGTVFAAFVATWWTVRSNRKRL